jgi:hypothetical protein
MVLQFNLCCFVIHLIRKLIDLLNLSNISVMEVAEYMFIHMRDL